MKRIRAVLLTASLYLFILTGTQVTYAGKASPGELYSLSAVLMDGDSGRVLYEKEGTAARANASTTKVLTCLLAIEKASGDDYVPVSANAASQPEVKAGLQEGEQYYLEDLLYSMMLGSHNDSAVAVAEAVGGSVENFASMLNARAKQMGCTDTHFVTPNGLDAEDSDGTHHTTARDLALIMRCASQNQTFLKITETKEHSFTDLTGKHQFYVRNTNALLDMTDGVLCGKTGFTGDAGYCYVCAVKRDDRTFVIALLGAGWPNNKTYKWKDVFALLEYGSSNFEYKTFSPEPELPLIPVKDGVSPGGGLNREVYVSTVSSAAEEKQSFRLLCGKDEKFTMTVKLKDTLTAPVQKGQKIGEITYYLGKDQLASYPVNAASDVKKMSYAWCADWVFDHYFH